MSRRSATPLALVLAACPGPGTGETTGDPGTGSSGVDPTGDPGTADTTAPSDPSDASDSIATTTPDPCDDDPACGPGEDVMSCPAQCSVCGDGVVSGAEECDNGVNKSAAYLPSMPVANACAPGCKQVQYCGDGAVNGPEPCDGGGAQTGACEADCRAPSCGDGVLNALVGEVCDDDNAADGDGCAGDCLAVERRLFVTSETFPGDLDAKDGNPDGLKGLALADLRCQALADNAGLPGTFKAWLSDAENAPADRLDAGFTGLYRLGSDEFPVVARGWTELVDGSLQHAVDADEFGYKANGEVWTNTRPDGTRASNLHCAGWTSTNGTTTIGATAGANATWTQLAADQPCAVARRIYCFEDLGT